MWMMEIESPKMDGCQFMAQRERDGDREVDDSPAVGERFKYILRMYEYRGRAEPRDGRVIWSGIASRTRAGITPS